MAQRSPSAKDKVVPLRPTRPCPLCGKPATRAAYPFCSTRCADIDLNRWLTGAYAIPAEEETPGEEEPRD
ncbi:MAG: DNA gyrase inhibitor YacG [Rhizobiales bacterium]|nr:DNA gyrase inhibitor YacG [Hyphomicrobiales bacterium]